MEHRLILGGEHLLPFARSCITKLRKLGLPYAEQSYEVDGVSVKVSIAPGYEYIRLEGSVGGYEFFVSDQRYTDTDPDPNAISLSTEGADGSPGTTTADGVLQLGCGVGFPNKPLFANTLTGTKAARVRATFDDINSIPATRPGFSYQLACNNQRTNSHRWWLNNDPSTFVISCNAWGTGRSWNNQLAKWYALTTEHYTTILKMSRWYPYVYLRPTPTQTPGGGGSNPVLNYSLVERTQPAILHEGADRWDIPPTLRTPQLVTTAGAKRTAHTNWRHAAVCSAQDGTKFFVSTDTHGVFTFYKVQSYAAEACDDIPVGDTYVVRPTYPAWVSVASDSVSTTADHWLWSFNKMATLAATTPLKKTPSSIYVRHRPNPYLADHSIVEYGSNSGWPDYLAGVEASVQLVPLYVRGSEFAVLLDGSMIAIDMGLHGVGYLTAAGLASIADPSPASWTRGEDTTPGFVEVSIAITKSGATYIPAVTVVHEEEYDVRGRFYVQADYYVRTPRTALKDGVWPGAGYATFEPEEDALLTAEIEVVYTSDNYAASAHYPNIYDSVAGLDFAYFQANGISAYLTLRERSTDLVVKKLCLIDGMDFASRTLNRQDYGDNYTLTHQKCMFGVVSAMDLRYLSFMTTSYSRRLIPGPMTTRVVGDNTEFDINGVWFDKAAVVRPDHLKPRFEVRVHGTPMMTVDYSDPAITGFDQADGYGHDPMTSSVPASGATDHSTLTGHKTITFALKQFVAQHHLQIENLSVFAFSPDGRWAVYADRRGYEELYGGTLREELMTVAEGSTATNGVFDKISTKRLVSSHKNAFNKAFAQTRDYSYWDGATGDLGGFATYGAWH